MKIKSATIYLFLYFFTLALLGSLLLQLPFFYKEGIEVPYIDSLFTTVSAICVTGLSTLDMKIYSPEGFCLILLLIEAGGLGLVSFFSAYLIFSAKKISLLNRNIIQDYFTEDSQVEVRGILKRILFITLTFQGIGAVLLSVILKFSGEEHSLFYGIFLSISAFCNAGFAPYSDNLVRFSNNIPLCLVIEILIVAGGLGFFVISEIWSVLITKKQKHLSLHTKLVLFISGILIFGGAIFILFAEKNNAFKNMNFIQSLNSAFFESVTFRTAGFETLPQKEFSPLTTFLSFFLMITGGSSGSMAGGLKTTSVFLVFYFVYKNSFDRGNAAIFKRDISTQTLEKAIKVCVRGICFVFVIFVFLLISENLSIKSGQFSASDLLFELISAFGTVGLSKGITANLSVFGKILIILSMFVGRTGITFISINALSSKNNLNSLADYPEEDVLIG